MKSEPELYCNPTISWESAGDVIGITFRMRTCRDGFAIWSADWNGAAVMKNGDNIRLCRSGERRDPVDLS